MIFVVALISKLLLFCIEIVPKAFVDTNVYGYFALNLAQIMLLSSFISFGSVNYLLKDMATCNSKTKSLILSCLISFIITSIILIGSFFVYVNKYVVFGSLLLSLIMILSTYYRFNSMTINWYILKDVVRSSFFIILLSMTFFIGYQIDLTILYFISLFLSFIILFFLVFKKMKFNKINLNSFKIKDITSRIVLSSPIVFTGISYLLVSRIDTFYVSKLLGIDVLADYSFVSRVMYQSLFFMQIIQAKHLHKIAKEFSQARNFEALKLSKKIRRESLILTAILSLIILLALNSSIVVNTFNIKVDNVFEISLIFLILHIGTAYFGLYGYMLLYIDKQVYSIFNSIIIICLSVLLLPFFISVFGSIGAAIATTISILIGNFLEKIQFTYFFNIKKR
ncbi:oligosaccharide flippase family protein [Aliivibrio sifiae]|uniref:Polysaccharide biosynthesis protein C-terminal domain-containing protein n=1 Tax=Aliivibrio sifiae TaxID=566293 RepID=A0A2S7X0G3_9GAMM|nr:oligosaccharide flippase family protein [Aliivibrio sifiae]PQJ83324.1 hypothetical protein BTO22_18220 [Aliivibrio sifiae]